MIAEFIPVSPQMLMDRIVSYELCCKGSWTIFFNLFLNHAHSAIVAPRRCLKYRPPPRPSSATAATSREFEGMR